jgi:hypothetical protein
MSTSIRIIRCVRLVNYSESSCVSIADASFARIYSSICCFTLASPRSRKANTTRRRRRLQRFTQFVTARFILQFQRKSESKRSKLSRPTSSYSKTRQSTARKEGKLMFATCSSDAPSVVCSVRHTALRSAPLPTSSSSVLPTNPEIN